MFGAERGEVSPAVPTLHSLCWGHEWGWLARAVGEAVICRGSQVEVLQENLLQICLGKVCSRAIQRDSPATHQAGCLELSLPTAAGVPMPMWVPPRTFAPKVRCLAIP